MLLLSLSLLSLTHFHAYIRLHELPSTLNQPSEEPRTEESDADGAEDTGWFKARYIRRTYSISILAQGLIILLLSIAREYTSVPGQLHSMLLVGAFCPSPHLIFACVWRRGI